MRNTSIEHVGTVYKTDANIVVVKITQHSACSSCEAKRLCSSSEQKEKYIEIDNKTNSGRFQVGEQVKIIGSTGMAFRAILFAFIIPSALIFTILIAANVYSTGEGISALLAIGVLPVYYCILYFFRNSLKNNLKFTLDKL
ncbi:MAG: SoxR reducing system RseC family protein [Bacteroidales bacterium]|nr:SoxR reducing system RseC family protein [Bacteroidales bacterium]